VPAHDAAPRLTGPVKPLRRFADVAGLALLMAGLLVLLPTQWGGTTTYVVVRGDSMIPTHHTGDLVIVREADSYHPGDIVAFRVPADDLGAGTILLHRIVGHSEGGRYILKGDHNTELDLWKPTPGDILGRARLAVPRLGTLLGQIRDPALLASLGFGVVFSLVVLRRET
jgi:signal peptidase I